MLQNIFVGILCVTTIGAGICAWIVDNVGTKDSSHVDDHKDAQQDK